MKICIDAGHNHSGYDTGAIGNGLREQDVTFEIADILKMLLVNIGVEVVMTRKSLTENIGTSLNSSINNRCKISNTNNCDYFISIHCNAFNTMAHGTEILVYKKQGKAEMLAQRVLARIINNIGTTNRGIKEKNIGVLRDTICPAILIETAFIDNVTDAMILMNNQSEIANAIFYGICDFLNLPTSESEAISLSTEEEKNILKTKIGLSDETITFLECYKYGEDLIKKIIKAVK